MRIVYSAALILAMVGGQVWAATPATPTQGVFTSVNGKVQIENKKGKKARPAQKDSTVLEGERIVTGQNSNATLRLFDGSELNISPKTDFQLAKLQKPSTDDKIMKFKLFVGSLFAKVKKLASSKSSFEIEAGGVVCGVRGTQFSMDFNPDQHKLNLQVFEGSVYAVSGGNTNIFGAGQGMEFLNGQPNGKPGSNGGNPGGNGQGNNQGGNEGNNPGGTNPNGGQPGALGDLNNQFGNQLTINGDNNFTDPGVAGSIHLTVHAHVGAVENVP